MTPEAAAALWGAAIAGVVAVVIFGFERNLASRRDEREARRVEFDKLLNNAREYVLDVIAGRSVDPTRSKLLLTPITLRLNLKPRADDSVTWAEMVIERILLLGSVRATNEKEKSALARQLEGSLRLLSDVLVYEHRGVYDHMSTAPSFIGMMHEIEAREHKPFKGDAPWWAQEPPEWLVAPEPVPRSARMRSATRLALQRLLPGRKRREARIMAALRSKSADLRLAYERVDRRIDEFEVESAERQRTFESETRQQLNGLSKKDRRAVRAALAEEGIIIPKKRASEYSED
jgi:hypothetical protein